MNLNKKNCLVALIICKSLGSIANAQAIKKPILPGFLKALYGTMHISAIQYDGTRKLNEHQFKQNSLRTDSAQWSVILDTKQIQKQNKMQATK
ncbi:hypothetical protein [Pedobacter sp. NJ-S-72]